VEAQSIVEFRPRQEGNTLHAILAPKKPETGQKPKQPQGGQPKPAVQSAPAPSAPAASVPPPQVAKPAS